MDEQLKNNAHLLCQKIRELTEDLDKSINNISKGNILEQNVKIVVKEKEQLKKNIVVKPPAGRMGTKWDNTIIDWKCSLRRPW